MVAKWKKSKRVRGEKLKFQRYSIFQEPGHKEKRARVRVGESICFSEDDVLDMGSTCTCLTLDGDTSSSLSLVHWKVSVSLLLTYLSGNIYELLYGVKN